MAIIVKVYKETLPATRLIGKKYLNAERRPGYNTDVWEEWFQKGWFEPLQALELVDVEGDAYIGSMRYEEDKLVYWIGMLAKEDSEVPAGYDCLDIPAGEIGVLWIQGPDDYDLYSLHDQCVQALREQGMEVASDADFFERYTQKRFVTPDQNGNVILDYCAHL